VSRNTLKARLWRARQQLAARLGDVLRGPRRPAGGGSSLGGGLAESFQAAAGGATGD
jgi:hypothetical protein